MQSRIDQKQRPFTPIARHYGNPLSGLYKTQEGFQVYLIGADAIRHWPNTVAALDKPEVGAATPFVTSLGLRGSGSARTVARGPALSVRTGPPRERSGAV